MNIITGIVDKVIYSKHNDTTDIILSDKIILSNHGYIDIKINDKLYAVITDNGLITSVRINVPENDSYVNYFMYEYFTQSYGKKVFSDLRSRIAGNLFEYLEKTSAILVNSPGDFSDINILKSDASWKKFLFAWYKNCFSRPLRILGITQEIIDNMLIKNDYSIHLDLKNVHYNPYTNPWIPPMICEKIVTLFGTSQLIDINDKIKHGIVHEISLRTSNQHWNYCPRKYIRIDEKVKDDLVERFNFYEDEDNYYIDIIRNSQNFVIDFLVDLANSKYESIPRILIESTKISDEQLNAVDQAIYGSDNIVLISGRAGTGKTRVIAEIAYKLEMTNCYYMIVSFTGKAIARVKETVRKYHPEMTSIENQITTIHRLMTANYDKIPEIEVLIIEEFSMVSTKLFFKMIMIFYKKIKRIVGVGDNNQLSPIEWGSLYSQMYKSQVFRTYELKTSFRTTEESGSGILEIANGIIDDPNFKYRNNSNFVGKAYNNYEKQLQDMIDFCKIYEDDGIILTCYNKDKDFCNKFIQESIRIDNSDFVEEKFNFHFNRKLYVGDKVMQKENINDQNVFNGDIGIITQISSDHIYVLFKSKDHKLKYYLSEFTEVDQIVKDYKTREFKNMKRKERNVLISKDLDLAYVITVNKSQGSEWPHVMGILTDIKLGNFINMEKIYTMITRAQNTFYMMIDNIDVVTNHSKIKQSFKYDDTAKFLKQMLPQLSDVDDFNYEESEIEFNSLSDLIG